MESIEYFVTEKESGIRVDKFLSEKQEALSRSFLQKQLKNNLVFLGEKPVKSNYKVVNGDKITLVLKEEEPNEILPENIPLDILYEDEDLLVVNKPKGMVVHPAAGHMSQTLVNALLYHCGEHLSDINGILRPGIVHRIDKDTTGVLVVCKTNEAHIDLATQLKEHSITREYHAIVHDRIKEENGTIDAPIGRHQVDRKKQAIKVLDGRKAVTHYEVLDRFLKYTYVKCFLETGRTHQIRVHMASIHHPVLGDTVYGPKKSPMTLQGQTLHAKVLGFVHPRTKEYMEFEAPLPEYFQKLLKHLPRL